MDRGSCWGARQRGSHVPHATSGQLAGWRSPTSNWPGGKFRHQIDGFADVANLPVQYTDLIEWPTTSISLSEGGGEIKPTTLRAFPTAWVR